MDGLPPAGVVEAFLDGRQDSGLTDKMPEPMLVPDGNVVELTLIAVYAEHQHKGYASRALKMLTTLCDQNGITITLTSRGLDEAALSAVAPGCLRLS